MDENIAGRVRALEAEIRDLKSRISDLRLGRRVLMNLVEMLEDKRREEKERLEQEIERLRLRNNHLARLLWDKSRIIVELQAKTAAAEPETGERSIG